MKISVFGLGYVGCVSVGCLAACGHDIIGVDIDKSKVEHINEGKPTIVEKGIEELIYNSHMLGRIRATQDAAYAVENTGISIISVGTPGSETGELNLEAVFKAAEQIGDGLRNKTDFHVVVIRSTVLPGTNMKVAGILETRSGKTNKADFGVVSNPEFLREGTAVYDYMNPPFTLIGSESERALEITEQLYEEIETPIVREDPNVCEIMKYICNTFHALKIVFANEVGNICKKLGIDSHKVMNVFCMDTKLNLSPYYLKPGFAYGGSCLPKDLKGLCTLAEGCNIEVPVLASISRSNELQKETAIKMITDRGKRNIGVLGLSFKAGTDDVRESPVVDIVERLIDREYNVKIYDKNVHSSMPASISHLAPSIRKSPEEVVESSEVIVITYKDDELRAFFDNCPVKLDQKVIIDLARMEEAKNRAGEYDGICW